jgi:hypothetical protein
MRGREVNNKLERMWKEAAMPNLKHYPDICLGELRKTMKGFSQNSRSPARNFNPGPSEYEAGLLTT